MHRRTDRCQGFLTQDSLWPPTPEATIYLSRVNWQDPLKRKFLHRCRPSQDPGQSLALHSLSLVLATTFGCPKGQQEANFSVFWRMSDTLVESPKPRLNIRKSVSTAPWLEQINFSMSDSLMFTLFPRASCLRRAGLRAGVCDCSATCSLRWKRKARYRFWWLETET